MHNDQDCDLAHEHDMERLRREQLRADISPKEAAEEIADWDDAPMGDPDEYWEEDPGDPDFI